MNTTILKISNNLLEEALLVSNNHSKEEIIAKALVEYIAKKKRLASLQSFGKLEMNSDFDYKIDRNQA